MRSTYIEISSFIDSPLMAVLVWAFYFAYKAGKIVESKKNYRKEKRLPGIKLGSHGLRRDIQSFPLFVDWQS